MASSVIIDKGAKGRKGTIVAIVEGMKSEKLIEALEHISEEQRSKVKEVTLDMSTNASAESFNAKINAFRATLRGITECYD
jgi:transposase